MGETMNLDQIAEWDRHQNQVGLIQAVKGGEALTHREIRRRDPSLGTLPYPMMFHLFTCKNIEGV